MLPLTGANYSEVLIDEICLEGLDGITLQALWIRLAERLGFEVPDKLKNRFWKLITQFKDVDFYELPKPRQPFVLHQRFILTKGISSLNKDADLDNTYPYHPIKDDHGSCLYFKTRKEISKDVRALSLDECLERWGNSLVIVGKFEVRWAAMAGSSSIPMQTHLNSTQYCLLERIARARYNGELTSGENSLLVIDDPKTLFYHRKTLLRLGLISRKNLSAPVSSPITSCLLLRLKRFTRPLTMKKDWIFDECVLYLMSKPNHISSVNDMKQLFTRLDPAISIKKVMKTPTFMKYFKSEFKVKYREIFPDAEEKRWKILSNGEERLVHAVQLKKDISSHKEIQEEINEDEVEPDVSSSGSCLMGENISYQMYQLIREAGQEGLAKSELSQLMGLDQLSVRLFTKHLVTLGVVQVTMHDQFKQRTAKYTSQEFICNITKTIEQEKGKMEAMKEKTTDVSFESLNDSAENESVTEPATICDVESEQLNVSDGKINVQDTPSKISQPEKTSGKFQSNGLRFLRRANLIMEQLKKRHVILNSQFLGELTRLEASTIPVHGIMDRRSLLRILEYLEKDGQLKLLKVETKKTQPLVFICEPHIEESNPLIQAVVEQISIKMAIKEVEVKRRQLNKLSHSRTINSKNSVKIGKEHGYLPKMARMNVLHEYLYYICYCHTGKVGALDELIPKKYLADKDLCSMIENAYENAPEKYLFVPPLPENTFRRMPSGWLFLGDIVYMMPLCIFLKIVNIGFKIPGLTEYINHPVKSRILIKNLPQSIQADLFYKQRYSASIRSTADRLCLIGLIKMGEQIGLKRCRVFIYMNRRTSILDTTTTSRGYNKIDDRPYNRESFLFNDIEDVKYYWNRLRSVCCNTKLGFRYAALGQQVEYQTPEVKMSSAMRAHSIDEIADDEYIPGDQSGAAGFDSTLYSHLKSSWEYLSGDVVQVKPIKRKLLGVTALNQDACPRKKPKLARNHDGYPSVKPKGKFIVRTLLPRREIVKKKPRQDEVDRQILTESKRLRAAWNPAEDRILLLARAAAALIFSSVQMAPAMTVRDILHAATRVKDKTSAACQRRILFILRNPVVARTVHLYTAEANRHKADLSRFTKYVAANRVAQSSPLYAEYEKQLKIRFIELTLILHQIIHSQYRINSIFIPDTLEEVRSKYLIDYPDPPYICREEEPKTSTNVRESILNSIIHSSLCCAGTMRTRSIQLLQLYRNFPESVLRQVIQKLRSSGMMALKKPSARFSLSHTYTSHLSVAIPYKIFFETYNHHSNMVKNNSFNSMLESLDSGAIALISEMQYSNRLSLTLNIPDNLIIDLGKFSADKSLDSSFKPSKNPVNSLQIIESIDPNIESCIISCSEVGIHLNCTSALLEEENEAVKKKLEELTRKLTRDGLLTITDDDVRGNLYTEQITRLQCNVELAKRLVGIIDEFENMGASSDNIKEKLALVESYELSELLKVFKALEEEGIIKRVGVVDSRWVLRCYYELWFVSTLPEFTSDYKILEAEAELAASGALNLHYNTNDNNLVTSKHIEDSMSTDVTTPIVIEDDNTKGKEDNCMNEINITIDTEINLATKHGNIEIGDRNDIHPTDNTENTSDIHKNTDVLVTMDTVPMDTESNSIQEENQTIKTNLNKETTEQFKEVLGNDIGKTLTKFDTKNTAGDNTNFNDFKYLVDASTQKYIMKVMTTPAMSTCKSDILLSPRPWIRVDGVLNLRVLWPWVRSVLLYLQNRPMMKLTEVQKRFHFMSPFHIRLLVELTSYIGCTKLVKIIASKPSLWKRPENSSITIEPVSILDNNDVIYIDTLENPIITLAFYQGSKPAAET